MQNPLIALSHELAATTERAGRLVAAVHARPRFSSSGLIWQKGVIVTADHTVRREDEIRVTLPDGNTVLAELAGRDPGTDLAVLKAETPDVAPLPLAAPGSIRTGNLLLAIGRSEETGVSAAMGVVSNSSGPRHTWRGGKLDQYLRLDVGLYPGASGGAVVDAEGAVIGIATSALSRMSVLAIPAATIQRVAGQLLQKGHVARGFLGVGLQPIALPEHLQGKVKVGDGSSKGALIVLSVELDGPAARGGMVIGDVLVALEDTRVDSTDDIQEFLGTESVGRTVHASVIRGGELARLAITIGERPRRRG